jgi:4-hydroxymandelate oxidase
LVKGILRGVTLPPGRRNCSNHGNSTPNLQSRRYIAAAIANNNSKNDIEILLDGGIRRGTDVLKALALGAKAVMIGRPVLWGLALYGQNGVEAVLNLLKSEFDLAMALTGCNNLAAITPDLITREK